MVGTRLLLGLTDAAIARGCTGLTLEVRVGNEGAQALYRFIGVGGARFEQLGTRQDVRVQARRWLRARARRARDEQGERGGEHELNAVCHGAPPMS